MIQVSAGEAMDFEMLSQAFKNTYKSWLLVTV